MATPKIFTIVQNRRNRDTEKTGSLAELISYYSYTLEKGKSWEHEKGNSKINLKPKSIASLVKNINNAENNAAANGWSGVTYSVKK